MAVFQQHDGRVKIEGLFIPDADFATIVPGFPALPDGMVGRLYDTGLQRHMLYDGRNRFPQVFPWAPADNVLGDFARIESEWNTIQASRRPPTEELRTRYEAARERLRGVEAEILAQRIDQWIARGQVDNALVRVRQDMQAVIANLESQLP